MSFDFPNVLIEISVLLIFNIQAFLFSQSMPTWLSFLGWLDSPFLPFCKTTWRAFKVPLSSVADTRSLVHVNYLYAPFGLNLPNIPLVLLPDVSKQMVKIENENEFFPISNLPLSPPLLQQRNYLSPGWSSGWVNLTRQGLVSLHQERSTKQEGVFQKKEEHTD